jgi:hypothetical protein
MSPWQCYRQHDSVATSCHGQRQLDNAITSMTRQRHHAMTNVASASQSPTRLGNATTNVASVMPSPAWLGSDITPWQGDPPYLLQELNNLKHPNQAKSYTQETETRTKLDVHHNLQEASLTSQVEQEPREKASKEARSWETPKAKIHACAHSCEWFSHDS